jgi:hypothetical protein
VLERAVQSTRTGVLIIHDALTLPGRQRRSPCLFPGPLLDEGE